MKIITHHIKKLLFSSFLVFFFLQACKKDPASLIQMKALIKTIEYSNQYGNNFKDSFIYDGNNQVKQIYKIILSGTSDTTIELSQYEYKDDSIIITHSDNLSSYTYLEAYRLNNKGLAEIHQWLAGFIYGDSVLYNGNNFKKIVVGDGLDNLSFDTLEVMNGNYVKEIIAITDYPNHAYLRSYKTFDFDISKFNSVSNEAKGMSFLGRSNTNLISHVNEIENFQYPPYTITIRDFYYFYEYDFLDRVTKIVQKDSDGNIITTELYTYY